MRAQQPRFMPEPSPNRATIFRNNAMTLLAFAAALSLGAAAPAPSDQPVVPAARVAFGDLDLASASGARMLEARIERSARRTCTALNGRGVSGRADCLAGFREEALDRLPAPAREDYARGQSARIEL